MSKEINFDQVQLDPETFRFNPNRFNKDDLVEVKNHDLAGKVVAAGGLVGVSALATVNPAMASPVTQAASEIDPELFGEVVAGIATGVGCALWEVAEAKSNDKQIDAGESLQIVGNLVAGFVAGFGSVRGYHALRSEDSQRILDSLTSLTPPALYLIYKTKNFAQKVKDTAGRVGEGVISGVGAVHKNNLQADEARMQSAIDKAYNTKNYGRAVGILQGAGIKDPNQIVSIIQGFNIYSNAQINQLKKELRIRD